MTVVKVEVLDGEEIAGEGPSGGAVGSDDVVVLGSVDEHCVKVSLFFAMRS